MNQLRLRGLSKYRSRIYLIMLAPAAIASAVLVGFIVNLIVNEIPYTKQIFRDPGTPFFLSDPFIRTLFLPGSMIISSWIVGKGIFNFYNKKPFLDKMKLSKVLIIVFCVALADSLRAGDFVSLLVAGIIGWALWDCDDRYGPFINS